MKNSIFGSVVLSLLVMLFATVATANKANAGDRGFSRSVIVNRGFNGGFNNRAVIVNRGQLGCSAGRGFSRGFSPGFSGGFNRGFSPIVIDRGFGGFGGFNRGFSFRF